MASTPAFLNINSSAVAFQDQVLTNNPLLRSFDWNRRLNNIQVASPEARTFTVPGRQMMTLFNSARATTIDATTIFAVKYLSGSTYRFAWTGGTNPSLATDQALTFGVTNFTVAVASNQVVTITALSGTPFINVTAGATLYINGPTDVAVPTFNILNSGYWNVSTATSTVLTLVRPSGSPFSAIAETVTGATGANDMIAFVPTTVQVGDKMRISAGFAVDTRQTYEVVEVTSDWVKVVSTLPLPDEAGIIPTSSGMVFYLAKRFTRIEVNQRANIYYNGAGDQAQELEPWVSGDASQMAWQERVGPVWSLLVYNLSQVPMTVNVFSCE
jgi:hypothetical protein